MAKKPVTDKKPIMWGHRYWSYRETGMGAARHHPCGGLFAYKIVMKWIIVIILSIIALSGGVWTAIGVFVLGVIIISILSK